MKLFQSKKAKIEGTRFTQSQKGKMSRPPNLIHSGGVTLMTTKHMSPTSGSSIHPRLSEVNGAGRALRALCITPFTISGKGSQYPTRHQSTKSNLEEGTPIEFQGGRSPKEINPKLRICKGSNTWYQSSVLGISLPFHSHPSSLHSRPKQFPQLLKRSSSNPTVISTTSFDLPVNCNRGSKPGAPLVILKPGIFWMAPRGSVQIVPYVPRLSDGLFLNLVEFSFCGSHLVEWDAAFLIEPLQILSLGITKLQQQ
ncbi:hypothetical protein C4D60_Mb10t25650 [Musa balbisiana]|uniref:Uncharacterized protein n=1 Tax=Musa balbisiana TaxID=52838 RepID=A0A4S8J293_MUSBA|nr:hypothetical protein C4D60_Mb10t25650 [Musa balbisiana]